MRHGYRTYKYGLGGNHWQEEAEADPKAEADTYYFYGGYYGGLGYHSLGYRAFRYGPGGHYYGKRRPSLTTATLWPPTPSTATLPSLPPPP